MRPRRSQLRARSAPSADSDWRLACYFGKLIADETEKWGKVVQFAGIKPE